MDKKDVFISYRPISATDAVHQITEALEAAGISCWYAPRNLEEGTRYSSVIVDAIDDCKVFLVLLDEESQQSFHMINEIECAFERYNQQAEIILIPFYMGVSTLNGSFRYFLKSIHGMDGETPPFDDRVTDLVNRISNILGKKTEYRALIPDFENTKKKKVYSLAETKSKVYPSKYFVGRKAELKSIHECLSSDVNVLALVGMGGIGKTELVKAYINEHRSEYDIVVWIPFDTSIEQTLGNDYIFPIQGMDREDYKEDTSREYFERKLRVWKKLGDRRVLLVMDNFDVTDDPDLEAFCSGEQTILFTTRYEQECEWLPELRINEMTDKKELMELFRKEYKRRLNPKEEATVYEIIGFLHNHTMAVRQVASAMNSGRIQPEAMLAMLQEGAVKMGQTNKLAKDQVFGSLERIFKIASLTEEEEYVMKNLSLISLQGITVSELYQWCGMEDFEVIDGLISRNWIVYSPETDVVHLHPLIAQLVLQTLERDGESCKKMLRCMYNECKKADTASDRKLQLMDFAKTAYERLPENHPLKKDALKAMVKIMKVRAMLTECIPYYTKMLEYTDSLAEQIDIYNMIAHCHTLSGNHQDGLEVALKGCGLVEDKDVPGMSLEEGGNYCDLVIRVSECYRETGRYEEAIVWAKRAIELSGRFYQSTPQTMEGWSRFHLGAVYQEMERYEEARTELEKAVTLFEEVENQASIAFAQERLSQILIPLGEYESAISYVSQAYDVLMEIYGPYHFDIAVNFEWKANIYRAMGEEENAAYYYKKAAEVYRKCGLLKREERVQALLNS